MECKSVNILQEKNPTTNGRAFVFPLYVNRNRLKDYHIELNFLNQLSDSLFDCDILLVTSIFAREKLWWQQSKKDEMFRFFERARAQATSLVWVDLLDGTCPAHFEVLPFVDRYFKGSVLKNKQEYQRFLYGSRYFTDYYHNEFGILDDDAGEPHLNHPPQDSELHKIMVSWNSALFNYSYYGHLWRRLRWHLKWLPYLEVNSWTPPKRNREVLISCRVGSKYRRNTVSFQRCQLLRHINGRVPKHRLNLRQYFRELRNSRVGISPFGWGEICYRDFEIVMSGATMMKPDCDHMETWPDLYQKDKTYLSFSWDFSDIDEIIRSLPDRLEQLSEIAEAAQNRYRYYLSAEGGRMEFCNRFRSLIDFN